MNYYLGVDGGGSKTIAVIADEIGRIKGRGTSGCGNHQLGAELAERSIRHAVGEALAEAGLRPQDISFASFGLAGADREADFVVLRPMVGALGFANYHIVCDTVIAMRAGTRQRAGVVLICGSGTNSYGMNADGEEIQIGGFGYEFGDFGGGYALAVEVFRTVIRAWEGRENSTVLTALTLEALGFSSVEKMFHHFLDEERRIPHSLAKLLFQAAPEDQAARRILEQQGIELGTAACAVIRRLGMQDDSFDVVLAGSVLTRGEGNYVVSHIRRLVNQTAPKGRIRILDLEPAAGAVLLGMDLITGPPDAAVYNQLYQELALKEMEMTWTQD